MLVREDGFISIRKRKSGKPIFMSPEAFLRDKLRMILTNCKKRAEKENIPCQITLQYLKDIFPRNMICPVFNIPMQWGKETGRDNCPSLDRLVPAKGYVDGNVVFVSMKANRIKSNANLYELKKLVDFYSDKL